jgi:hypothetical protein
LTLWHFFLLGDCSKGGFAAMASISDMNPSVEQRERLFFLLYALAIAGIVVCAFSLFLAAGLSTFASPWWVHVHAVTFMGWIGIYIAQNALVFRNDIALHRRLGRLAALYALWMVLLGLVLTPWTLAVGRAPPFFTPPFFLALDWLNILVFGGLIAGGIANRKRTDWHRRLMLCATISLVAVAWGRLVILSGNELTIWVNVSFLLLLVALGMAFDLFNRGKVHSAYYWGFGSLLAWAGGTAFLAELAPFVALAGRITG